MSIRYTGMNRFFLLVAFVFLIIIKPVFAIHMPALLYPKLVERFYQQNNDSLFWFSNNSNAISLRNALMQLVDSSAFNGLDRSKYHCNDMVANQSINGDAIVQLDKVYTDAAIGYFKDLYQGCDIANWFSYNEISKKYTVTDDDSILYWLGKVRTGSDIYSLVAHILPKTESYTLIQKELGRQMAQRNNHKIKQLQQALNMQRWIYHFRFKKYIVINIPAALLYYYEEDSTLLSMKIIAGKPATRTPRFAAYCNQVVFYPYWHVPRSIAVNEILPMCKRNRNTIDGLGLQVLDAHGSLVNPHNINWHEYNKSNFPYVFRQSTGCDNSLGVIKFNLTDPFNVYMHDTNSKTLFNSTYRYYSHGCIRIEKPVELASYLLHNIVDTTFLKACIKGQQPVVTNVHDAVPVFVTYSTVDVNALGIHYYADVYKLF